MSGTRVTIEIDFKDEFADFGAVERYVEETIGGLLQDDEIVERYEITGLYSLED